MLKLKLGTSIVTPGISIQKPGTSTLKATRTINRGDFATQQLVKSEAATFYRNSAAWIDKWRASQSALGGGMGVSERRVLINHPECADGATTKPSFSSLEGMAASLSKSLSLLPTRPPCVHPHRGCVYGQDLERDHAHSTRFRPPCVHASLGMWSGLASLLLPCVPRVARR